MAIFPCDLCGSDKAVEVPHARLYTNDQPIHICTQCGFVYVKERRTPEEVAKAWSEELYGDNYTARIPAVLARQTYVADTLDAEFGLAGKKLVDIGAGEGQFLEIASKQYNADVFGIEPSKKNCKSLSEAGFNCFHGIIEDYIATTPPCDADFVTIMWTLENCTSCIDMLKAAHAIVKPGGYVCVATGSRLLVPFKKPLWDYLSKNPADTHSFRFSVNTLRGLMAINGFKPAYVNRYLDSDYLMVVGEKVADGETINWHGDDCLAVHDFFDRWHKETIHYCPDEKVMK